MENPVDILRKENSQLRSTFSRKPVASAEGGYSEMLAPSGAATLSGLQDRAVGQATALQIGPDSNKLVHTLTCSLNTTPGLVKQLFKKHCSLGGKNPPET